MANDVGLSHPQFISCDRETLLFWPFWSKTEISLVSVREYDWKETAAVGVKTKTLAHATYNANTKTMCPWALLCDILALKRNMYTACVNVCDILLPWNSRFLETEFIFSAYLCTRPHVLSHERREVTCSTAAPLPTQTISFEIWSCWLIN